MKALSPEDLQAIAEYQATWGNGPFETADCVILHRGAVLLIVRDNPPCAGTWATPGGFLETGERPYMAALRELVQETNLRLKVGRATILGLDGILRYIERAYVGRFRKEGRGRDPRAHINTTVFVFDLDRIGVIDRPLVQGADDARLAAWKELDEVPKLDTYADHDQNIVEAVRLARQGA